jgi:predicted SnoaL-like aldol condensation-catalyzing enzyme
MRAGLLLLAAALAGSLAGCAPATAGPVRIAPPPSPAQSEAERRSAPPGDKSPKAVVNAFNQMAFFDGDPIGAMQRYLADDFIERYPDFANDAFPTDKLAMLDFFERRGWKKGQGNADTVYQVIAEGDRVAVFHHVTLAPGERGLAFVDIFRVRDGLIVEHWAVGQPVSEKVSAMHPMF